VGGFLILLVILVGVWALFVVPARRRQRSHSGMQDAIDVGDEIITAGGLHGTVREIDDATARVEIAPNVVVTLDRRAIAAVATEIEVEPEPGEDEDVDPAPGTEAEPS
jgi:preprotein translocase subunit YajC